MKMNLKASVICFATLVSLIPMIIIAIVCQSIISGNNYKEAENILNTKLGTITEGVNNYYNVKTEVGSIVSHHNTIKTYVANFNNSQNKEEAEQKLNSIFSQQKQLDDSLQNIILFDKDMNEKIEMTDLGVDPVKSIAGHYYTEVSDSISRFFTISISGIDTVCFSVLNTVTDDDNRVTGYIAMVYTTNNLQSYIKYDSLNNNTISMIIDNAGNIVLFPYASLSNIDQSVRYYPLKDIYSDALNGKSSVAKVKIDDNYKRCLAKKSDTYGYTVISQMDEMTVKNNVQSSLTTVTVTVIIFSVIIVFVIFAFVLVYFKPLEQLLVSCKDKVAGKNFTKVHEKSNNDLKNIINACNKMADEIIEKDERYKTIVEMNDNIVFEYDILKDDMMFSKNFNNKFSFRPSSFRFADSFLNKCPLHPDDVEKYNEFINSAFVGKANAQSEFRFRTIYGDYIWFIIRCTLLFDKNKNPIKIIGIMVDIDNAKKYEGSLIKRAEFDSLTKLLNRETFEKRLRAEYRLYLMRKQITSVIFIDIDDFKRYNDTYSHACGDEVLEFIATKIQSVLGEKGFAGRYGGDEFVVCFNSEDSKKLTTEFAKKLISELSTGFECKAAKETLEVNCSIGISYFNEERNNLNNVIDEADEAMYLVKKHGKSNFKEYV